MGKSELVVKGRQEFMGKDIPIVLGGFGEGKKCVSDKTIAEVHDMNAFDVRRRITDNIKRFTENIDFIDFKKRMHEMQTLELLQNLGYAKQSITQAEHIYILSERGYAKLIKIMDTDLAWEIHDKLMDEYFQLREDRQSKSKSSSEERYRIMDMNARSRMAQTYLKIGEISTLSPTYKNVIASKACEILAGEQIIPLPEVAQRKVYTAKDIGDMFGISANMIGRIANRHNLKTEDYGEYRRDKSKHSAHECDTWVYFETVIPEFARILGKGEEE